MIKNLENYQNFMKKTRLDFLNKNLIIYLIIFGQMIYKNSMDKLFKKNKYQINFLYY